MDTRIGDAEREGATTRLNNHFAAGRLDHEEYAERLDAIWSARTRADLDQLFWDLPHTPAPVVAARPAPVARSGMPTFVPVLVIAIIVGVAVVKSAPLVLLIAAVWFVFLRPSRRHTRHGHRGMKACR
jgi:hypothetical protein